MVVAHNSYHTVGDQFEMRPLLFYSPLRIDICRGYREELLVNLRAKHFGRAE